MNFCGIICEFNPFHNGHEYIISKAREKTNAEIICLMSGDFVQRGSPAIQNKYERAKNAVNNGASAVLELPTIFACSNAENFAFGAVKILTALNVKYLAFGVENANIEILKKIAQLKYENSERFKNAFKNEIQNGINYNTALKRSIAKLFNDEKIIDILNKPNNILAIEYLTAILRQKSKIIPVAINRCDNGYNSIESTSKYLSASSIRERIFNNEPIYNYIPKNAEINNYFNKNNEKIIKLLQILKIKQSNIKQLNSLYDYTEGIEYRVFNACLNYKNFDEIKSNIITPRYREPRVNKLLIYPLLNITKDVMNIAYHTKPVVKLLAINKNFRDFLKIYNKNKISIIVSNKDYEKLSKKQLKIIDIDLLASEIYQTITEGQPNLDKKNGTKFI